MKFLYSRIKHVCFDKDGTLIDVHATWVPITQRRAEKIVQYFELPPEFIRDLCAVMGVDIKSQRIISGGPVGYKPRIDIINSANAWLKQQKIQATREALAEIFHQIDIEIQNTSDCSLEVLNGVVQGIKELKKAGLKISIYSSDRNKNIQKTLTVLGLQDMVDAVIGGDDVKNPKPDPEGFIKACEQVGVDLERSVYVGDTVDDMRMARLTKCAGCFGLSHGLASRKELEIQSDLVFDKFSDLVRSFLN